MESVWLTLSGVKGFTQLLSWRVLGDPSRPCLVDTLGCRSHLGNREELKYSLFWIRSIHLQRLAAPRALHLQTLRGILPRRRHGRSTATARFAYNGGALAENCCSVRFLSSDTRLGFAPHPSKIDPFFSLSRDTESEIKTDAVFSAESGNTFFFLINESGNTWYHA